MAHPHHIPDYASPRSSLQSPGLTHRGKTPRSGGFGDEPQHAHFQFNEFGLDVSASGGGVGEGSDRLMTNKRNPTPMNHIATPQSANLNTL